MLKLWTVSFSLLLAASAGSLYAQIPAPVIASSGAVLVMPAFGQIRQSNDQAHASFMVEEQATEQAVAASRVNQKMKQGTELLRSADSGAALQTRGYYSYPVYAEENAQLSGSASSKSRRLIGWRVGQYLELTTTNLDGLAKTVASAQNIMALSGLQFGLSDATRKRLDRQLIQLTYLNLAQRIEATAVAIGRTAVDATIETIDFEGSGAYAPLAASPKMMMRSAAAAESRVSEPSFEPGDTVLDMRVVGRIKFK